MVKEDIAILGIMGSGKCHGKGTEVIMYDGNTKKVEDVIVGDILIGPDSAPRHVLNVSRGVGNLYKVVPIRGGDAFTCTSNHVLPLFCAHNRSKYANTFRNVSIAEYIASSEHSVLRENYKLWHSDMIEFLPQTGILEVPPYLYGVWLGDGSNQHNQFSITNPEPEIEEYLQEYAQQNNYRIRKYVGDIKNKKTCPTYFLLSGGIPNNYTRFFKNVMDVCGDKGILHKYLTASVDARLELLAGLIDTDGYYHEKGYEIIIKSDGMAKDVAFLARSLGISVTTSRKKSGIKSTGFIGIYNRLNLSGDNLSNIPCKVARKKPEVRNQIKNALVSGFTVSHVGIDEYFGFEVDGDHLYLLEDFTVTHNSTIGGLLAKTLDYEFFEESFLTCPTLEKYYQNPAKYALATELWFLREKAKQHIEIGRYEGSTVQDSPIQAAIGIFMYAMNNMGILKDREQSLLNDIYLDFIKPVIPVPTHFVYLDVDTNVLVDRIRKRGRDFESSCDPEYIKASVDAADALIEYCSSRGESLINPLIVVDGNGTPTEIVSEILEKLR